MMVRCGEMREKSNRRRMYGRLGLVGRRSECSVYDVRFGLIHVMLRT